MSVSQNNLFNPDSIIQTLQQRRFKQQLDIFDNSEPLEYWRLSDLANLYPNIFNVQRPITPSDIFKMNNTIKNSVPEFKNLSRIPVHVLDVRETYNILLPETNTNTKKMKFPSKFKNFSINFNISFIAFSGLILLFLIRSRIFIEI